MNDLDQALLLLREDANDPKKQSGFYDLFLNRTFFVPILGDDAALSADLTPQEGQVLPLVMESNGNDYLMLFDTQERLQAWIKEETNYVEVPGHVLAATSMPPLHWALNVGTDYSKEFVPDEIAWLREAVERCEAASKEAPETKEP